MRPERPLPPVRWLFGPDILASLKKIVLYSLSSGSLDLRDWMQGSVFDELKDREGEVWFDYVADTGDGQTATLSVARLCLTDVTVGEAPSHIKKEMPELTFPLTLPRGELLFVGGDAAYHVADKATLDARFCAPFRLAAEQVKLDRQDRRPLLGIPGNHDYYGQLDGFNRQFRRPLQGHEGLGASDELPLDVPGFRRVQSASYVAIQLPHGFWMLGMDTEQDKLDVRQSAFFRDILTSRGADPLKVIVATPTPAFALGRKPRRGDAAVAPLLDIEELRPPFVPPAPPAGRSSGGDDAAADIEGASQELRPGELRLYISGDMHHYERYFGMRGEDGRPACCAAVVSGGGGAFLQPAHTDFGEVKKRSAYPSPEASREAMAAVLQPWVVLNGGYIAFFGALLAVALYAAAALLRAPWRGLDALLRVLLGAGSSGAQDSAALESAAGKVGCILVITALLGGAVLAMMIGQSEEEKRAAQRSSPAAAPPRPRRRAAFNERIALGWAMLATAFAIVLVAAWGENALWVAFPAILVAVTLAAAGVWQSNRMIHAGSTRLRASAVTLVCAHAGAGLMAAAFSLARSDLEHAQSMVFDFAIGFLLLFMLLGCAVVLPLVGAGAHREIKKKLLFVSLGLYNFALVVLVPFVLIRTLSWDVRAAARLAAPALAAVAFAALGRRVFVSERRRRWLAIVWLALGAAWIFAPLYGSPHRIAIATTPVEHAAYVIVAAVVGALITSTSFGWYFATADTWDGHSNEVGGAALVEDYKQIIRFRLTREGLTGFVIAVDRPAIDPSAKGAQPRLVDVFELRPKI